MISLMGRAWSNSSWAPEVALVDRRRISRRIMKDKAARTHQAIDRLCSRSEVLDIPIDTDVSTIANSRSGTVIEGRFR